MYRLLREITQQRPGVNLILPLAEALRAPPARYSMEYVTCARGRGRHTPENRDGTHPRQPTPRRVAHTALPGLGLSLLYVCSRYRTINQMEQFIPEKYESRQ